MEKLTILIKLLTKNSLKIKLLNKMCASVA